jgi:hypothetical protein
MDLVKAYLYGGPCLRWIHDRINTMLLIEQTLIDELKKSDLLVTIFEEIQKAYDCDEIKALEVIMKSLYDDQFMKADNGVTYEYSPEVLAEFVKIGWIKMEKESMN